MYLNNLKQYFGFDSLRPGQDEVISKVVDGHSAAAIFPTGSGKSLCYQLPALQLPHLTLVISPLLALMKDQISFLHSKGIQAASIDSSQTWEETQQVMQGVRSGNIKILMISVERLNNERFRQFISQVPISLLVVDEAHCISEWGHNFRPDYLKLPQYRQLLNIPQVLLLTATATPAVISDMGQKFGIDTDDIVITGFYRHNLDLTIAPTPENEKQAALFQTLSSDPSLPSIVYVTLQKTAEDLAGYLQQQGMMAQAYHAGMDSERRQQIQNDFMAGKHQCIIATIAFGMGIDKSDIRRVIHFDLPKSIENYSQEIGRAGRDGQHSDCILLGSKSGLNVLENFVYGDTPDQSAIETVLGLIQQHAPQWEVVQLRLSKESNIRMLPLKTLLVYLEMSDIIEPQYTYFADYRFKLLVDQQFIINQFQGERQQFVSHIFACSPKARTWHTVDFDALWQTTQAERKRVVAAIDYFSEKGWVALESKQMTDVYRVTNPNFDIGQEAARLYQLFKTKEQSEISRLDNMLSFFESKQCLSHELASYFADHQAPQQCGHCSVCRGRIAKLPSDIQLADVSENMLKAWCDPFIAACPTPPSAAAITRFLCGMTSPLHNTIKARQLSGFGKMEQYPYQQTLTQISQCYPHLT
ncbi:ATP-dependent DNA helicase RecQ [Photobacterium gaetbulicola]|uniref:ATP-dependent DNA helicase RecQ n=1 Tax=Photobacterium gaetbulicola TaxID=1295392 RepID=A0A0B9GLA3_9GAMM|nr:ATP-dependent DNA helicase RecQ [Photobacterium gaetbulicola]KHT65630.1 ATP-dependent DNA helicase RecQ [Photobacterium gaetbulicola]